MILPIAVLALTFVAVILLDLWGLRKRIKLIAVSGFFAALLSLFVDVSIEIPLINADIFSVFFALIFLLVGMLVVLSTHEATAIFHGSIILSTIGMILAAAANDLILIYISIELVTSPTYVLVAYHKTAKRMEAAVKYFIIGIVASALLLFGLALLVATTGTTSISAMHFSTNPLFLLGIAAFIAGLGFKLGIFPFNFWIPDVYQGAAPEIAGFLAGASKKAAYAAFIRVAVVLAVLHNWALLFSVLAALTMTIANIIALMQSNVRRLLAYSIMSQAGFLLIGIAIATSIGYSATLFHAFTHAFMALGAFLVLGVLHKESIDDLKGMGWKSPFLAGALTIFLLSLAGIPLLSGFASKLYLFYAAADAGLVLLAVLAILNSVISLYYYFKIIRAMYAFDATPSQIHLRTGVKIAIVVCLIVTLVAGVYPGPFIDVAKAAANVLF